MRKIILLLLFWPLLGFTQMTDNFSDFEIFSSPTWTGDVDSFNASTGVLSSAGPPASSVISLVTANSMMDNTEWHFKLSLDFNPSSTNLVKIYLVSNSTNLEGSLNGYYVKFGETGNDSIIIYKQSGTTSTQVFKGTHTIMPSSSTSNQVGIKITRDASGNWEVFCDPSGGTAYLSEGVFSDNSFSSTSSFGVVCDYGTASRATLYHFDDFYIGNIILDTDPPTVSNVNILNLNTLAVSFNEYIDTSSAIATSNFSLSGATANPTLVQVDSLDKKTLLLFYAGGFVAGNNYTLTTNAVSDLAGNIMLTDHHSFYVPNKNDILINEIFFDPDSTVTSLPNAEYIELYNRSAYPISLNKWQLFDASTIGSNGASFPNYILAPNNYVIVCDLGDTIRFSPYGAFVALHSFPSLNNTGDELLLQDNFARAINYVNYATTWYHDDSKKDGGYAIERIDPSKYCVGADNWKVSSDARGGTPAMINAVNGIIADSTLPLLLRAAFIDSSTIELIFSESIDENSALNISNYTLDHGLSIASLSSSSNTNDRVLVHFSTQMLPETVYTISLQNVSDCSSNLIGLFSQASFGIPTYVSKNDIVINEILFNPVSGGYDFIELYNRSNKILDLKNLKLLEANPSDPLVITDNAIITSNSFLLLPNDFVVLSENTQNIQDLFTVPNPGKMLDVKGMPNYDDNEGIIELYQPLLTIDKLSYSHNWHFALLDNEEGVSLERINYNDTTQKQSNWHSAAKTVGYATPTYQNSEFVSNSSNANNISITPIVFTPNEDGLDDVCIINFDFEQAGYMLGIKIYDASGRLIKTLVNNEQVAQKGNYTWDGTNDEAAKAHVGMYIAYTEVFDLTGHVKHFKNKIILGTSFK